MAVVHDFNCPPEFEPEDVNPDDPSQVIADFEDENIELWMIKAPFNFDVSLLSGHELKNHFKIPSKDKSDTEYVAVATENHPMHKSLQAVVPHKSKNKLKIGPSFKGYIDIVKSVTIPKCDNPTLPQEKTYQIPSNLKQRYVPYGSHSPPRISSSQIVETKSKKRKRSSEILSLPMSDFDASQVSQMESEEPRLKKKRKKNKEKDLDESTASVGEMDYNRSVLSFQTSEAVPESYLPSSITVEEARSEKKRKRKRSRDSLEESLWKSVQVETQEEELTPVREKKKRKKNREEIEGIYLENIHGLENPESSQFDAHEETHTKSVEKKKKKHRVEKEKIENVDQNMETAEELAKKDSGLGSLEMEFGYVNSLDSMLEQPVSSSHKKKKKHKKKSLSENSLDETYSQLNIPTTNEEEKNIENGNQDVMASSMDTAGELAMKKVDDGSLELTHSPDSVPEQTVSSSHKKKHKKKSHSGNSSDETNSQLNVPITNEEGKNIEDRILNEMVSSMHTPGELAREDRSNGSLEISHLNFQGSVPEHVSSSHMKKIHKNLLSENSLDIIYSQLNIPITNEEKIEDVNQNAIASSMDTTELVREKFDNDSLELTHLNSLDSVLEQTDSSSHKKKKKSKKKSLLENSLDETYPQLNIPITNDEVKNIEDGNHNKRVVSMDTTGVMAKKDSVISSFILEPGNLNSENSVPEEPISSSHKKKKKSKKKSFLENSLDETYSQLNIPITNENRKNIEDGNQDVIASSIDTTGELATKKVDNGSLELSHLNSQDLVLEQTVSSSHKKKHKKKSHYENSLDETNSQLNMPLTSEEMKIVDVNRNEINSSMDTAGELARKDSGIGSLEMELGHLYSKNSLPEEPISSSHKKKHKKKSHSENSLDETYSQLNMPITKDEKNIKDGNQDVMASSMDTTGELAAKKADNGSLELTLLNSQDSVPEHMFSSSHKKKHKKKSLSENSLDDTYSQLNISISNDKVKNIDDGKLDDMAVSMHISEEMANEDSGHRSSSHKKKKKSKKKSLLENSLDETYRQLNIPITNDEVKNIEDDNHSKRVVSMDTTGVVAKKDSVIGSFELVLGNLNSENSVPEELISSSHKKKKKSKKKSFLENSLDETYSQLNIPITNEEQKNIVDSNQDVIASSIDTTGELATKKVDNGSLELSHLNSQDSVPDQTVSSSLKKKHKKKSHSENSLDETNSQLNMPIRNDEVKNIEDRFHNNWVLSMDSTGVLTNKESGIGSFELETSNLNSENPVPEDSISSSHKKKKHKKKSLSKDFLDEEKIIEDTNLNDTVISMDRAGELATKESDNGSSEFAHLNCNDSLVKQTVSSSHKKKKKHKSRSLSENSLDETYSQLNISIMNEDKKIETVNCNEMVSSMDTAKELAREDAGNGFLNMEFDHLNSVESMLKQPVSSHKKKHKKRSHSNDCSDEINSQLNVAT